MIEGGCTFTSELQMLTLILSNRNVSSPMTVSSLLSIKNGSTTTYGRGYPQLVEPGRRRVQASALTCYLYPSRWHLLITKACSICYQWMQKNHWNVVNNIPSTVSYEIGSLLKLYSLGSTSARHEPGPGNVGEPHIARNARKLAIPTTDRTKLTFPALFL